MAVDRRKAELKKEGKGKIKTIIEMKMKQEGAERKSTSFIIQHKGHKR